MKGMMGMMNMMMNPWGALHERASLFRRWDAFCFTSARRSTPVWHEKTP